MHATTEIKRERTGISLWKVKRLLKRIVKYRALYLMLLPGVLYFLVFEYGPLYGLQLAFKTYMYDKGITGSPWVGLNNFKYLQYDSGFMNALKNTFIISFGRLLFTFPAPIILALLLNEIGNRHFKRTVQSILYVPHFFSWVIVAGIFYSLFSTTSGLLGKISMSYFDTKMASILINPDYFLTIIFSTAVWHNAGWGTIIYLAAIAGVGPELYESAELDGASRFQKAMYITIPSIKFVIVMLLILNMGSVMNAGFDQIFNFYSPPTYKVGDIIDTYVFRTGILNGGFGISAAVGLFKNVINCILLFTANWIVKRLGEEGVF